MITDLKELEIKDLFTKRMITQRVKYKSKEYYKRQAEFFAGVITALGLLECPPYWSIACFSNREIVDEYKLS